MTKHSALDITAVLVLLVLCGSWGLQQVAIKFANEGISPVLQAGIRSSGATLLLLVWMKIRGVSLFDKDGTFWWGVAAGMLFAGEFLLIFWGLEFTYASRAVIFLYLSPFVVALGVHIFIPGEKLRLIQVIGLVCAFLGIISAFGESFTLPDGNMIIGDAMFIGAAVLWGATTVLIKASPLAVIAPSKTLLYQLIVSAFALVIGSFVIGEPGIIKLTPMVWGSLAYQTIWVAAITYTAWFWLVRHYPAAHLASFTFLTPLFGVLAGALILGEPVSMALIIALVLVGAGIYLVNKPA
ncbi:MAG: DMT family transporter [Alphaproteobacteria bacterium]|nr:DMT family transporter [Rhodospirillales bacterium]MCW9046218.1 DMT family transporter [Alphaproteobacteria bacterium]